MNERIAELLKQVGGIQYDEDGDELTPILVGKDLEKFAQLIVAECLDILMKPEYIMNHPDELSDYNRGWVNGRLLGIEHIKQDFGVEL